MLRKIHISLIVLVSAVLSSGCTIPKKIVIVAPSGGLSTKSEIQILNVKSFKKIVEEIIHEIPKGKRIGIIKNGIYDIYDDMLYGELKNSGLSVKKGYMNDLQNDTLDYYLLAYPRARGTVGEGFPSKNTYVNMKYLFTLIRADSMQMVWSREIVNQQIGEYDLHKVGGVFGL